MSNISKTIGLPDTPNQIAWIFASAFGALAIHFGLGRHVYYLSLSPEFLADLTQVTKWQFLGEFLLCISLFFTRISICLFLLRIFGAMPHWRRILYYVIAFMTLMNISSMMVVITQCRPLRKNWDPLVHGKCVSPAVVTFAAYFYGGELSHRYTHVQAKSSEVVSVVSDWILASLPTLCMWKIQMRPRLKAGICVLMAMGFL